MIKRYTFHFSAWVTRDVELPDGCEAGDDDFEAAINRAASDIDVDRYADFLDASEAEDDAELSK